MSVYIKSLMNVLNNIVIQHGFLLYIHLCKFSSIIKMESFDNFYYMKQKMAFKIPNEYCTNSVQTNTQKTHRILFIYLLKIIHKGAYLSLRSNTFAQVRNGTEFS
jgi:hypothetical protein